MLFLHRIRPRENFLFPKKKNCTGVVDLFALPPFHSFPHLPSIPSSTFSFSSLLHIFPSLPTLHYPLCTQAPRQVMSAIVPVSLPPPRSPSLPTTPLEYRGGHWGGASGNHARGSPQDCPQASHDSAEHLPHTAIVRLYIIS